MDSLLDGILDQDEAPAHSSVGRSNNRKSKRAGKKGNRSSVHANDDGEEETSAKNFRPMNKRSIPLPKGVKKGGSSGGSGDIFDSMFGGNAGGGSKARGKKKLGRGKSTSNLGLSGNSASASLTSPRSRSKTGGGLKEKKEEKKESGNKADFSSMYSKSSSDNRLGHADSHRKEEEEAGTGGIFLPGGGDSSSTDVEDEEVNNQHPQTSGRKANDDEGENWDEDGDDWDTETGENSPSLGSKSKSKLATRSIRASPTPSPSLSMSALNNRGSTGNGRRGRRGESIGSINTNSVAVDNVTANADSKPSPQGGAAGQEVVATLSKKERYRLMKEKRRQRNASANSNTSDSITTNSKTNNNSNGIEASSPSNQGSTAMNTNLNLNNNTNTIAATATPSHANKNIPPPSPSPSAFGEQDDEWGDADPLDMLGDNSNQMGHDYNPLTSNISKQSSAPLSMQIPSKQGASATGEDDISNGDDFSGGYTPSSVTSGRRGRGLGRKTMVGMGNNNGISNSISHNSASFGQVSPNSVSKPVSQSIRLKVSGKDNENAPIMSNRVRASSASARVDTAGSHSSNSLSKPLANVNEEPLAQQKMHHDLGSNTRIIANKNTNNNSINTASSDAITLDHWCVWLGLNPTSVIDKPLIRIAEKALSKAKLPKHYSFRNNTFTNAKTKTSSSAHPALKKYQEKLSQLRLAIQYGYDDLSDSETEETGTESMADIPNHSNTSIQSPASPHAHKAASPAASSSSSPSASSSSSPQHGIAQTMASRQERLSYLDASAAARATADSFGRGDNVRSATTAGTAATPSSILLQQQNSLPKAHSMSQSPFAAAANIGAGVDATNPIHQAELVALAKANDQTIQSLEKNREDLTHQLYTSNRHLQEMLSEQRLRLHAQHQDELNAVRRKVEQKETELRNEEARHQDTKRYYEQRIQEIELNRGQWIAENVKEATERAEERIQHTQKLYHKTLEHEKQKFKRETQSLQEQHRRDLSTVKAQQDNGTTAFTFHMKSVFTFLFFSRKCVLFHMLLFAAYKNYVDVIPRLFAVVNTAIVYMFIYLRTHLYPCIRIETRRCLLADINEQAGDAASVARDIEGKG